MNAAALPEGLALVAVDHIHPCPVQPRATVSVELVKKLAESMRAGRHDPLLEVEPALLQPGHYQIVCGEQRWRAAKEAGLDRVLVRLHKRLGYLERLQKQYEENRLRADLTPIEDVQLLVLAKTLRDVEAAERLLKDALIPFQPLEDKQIGNAAHIQEHLESLKALLLKHKLAVVKTAGGLVVSPLSAWRETEKALGLSEAARKAKLAILRLEPDVLEEVNALPAQHGPLIARVEDRDRRAELAARAPQLTHRQLQRAVTRLRRNPQLPVADAIAGRVRSEPEDPLAFETQLGRLSDLCRQIARLLGNLGSRVTPEEREQVCRTLALLAEAARNFEEAA